MHFFQFSEEKYSKFSEIFSKFPMNCHFRPNAQKINAWSAKILLKNAKITHFSQFAEEGFSKFSKKLLKISQQFVLFVQMRKKLMPNLLNYLQNMLK